MQPKHLDVILQKIADRENLDHLLAIWRLKDEKIVFTNGCFDILHRGHIEYLAAAADLGTKLIIGLNADESVRRLKGNDRPVNAFQDRALALASLHFSSLVVGFEEDTPENLIREIRPDILVKGGDYTRENIAGANFVEACGGKIAIISLTAGYSTTSFLSKLNGKR